LILHVHNDIDPMHPTRVFVYLRSSVSKSHLQQLLGSYGDKLCFQLLVAPAAVPPAPHQVILSCNIPDLSPLGVDHLWQASESGSKGLIGPASSPRYAANHVDYWMDGAAERSIRLSEAIH
jgi:hypothetical protein